MVSFISALQVSSGMAGALVVRGTRPPTPSANGDIDTLLKPISGQPFTERVLVFQQIQYACRNADGSIKRNPDNTYKCDPAMSAASRTMTSSALAPGPIRAVSPVSMARCSDACREPRPARSSAGAWSTAACATALRCKAAKRAPGAAEPAGLRTAAAQAFVDTNCTGAPVPYHLVAADGLTMAAATRTQVAVLQPGYRWDVLVVFPEPGDYCVLDNASTSGGNINQNLRPTQLRAPFASVAPR